MNAITATEAVRAAQAHGGAILALALSPHRWTIDAAIAAVADQPSQVLAAIDKLRRDLAPVPRDAGPSADWAEALDRRLRKLAAKIAPSMSVEQADAWCEAVVEALSDLPAMVALTAAKRAIHVPMTFLNEVEGIVRGIAAEVDRDRRAALRRLAELRDVLDRLQSPPAELSAPPIVTPEQAQAILQEFGLARPPVQHLAEALAA